MSNWNTFLKSVPAGVMIGLGVTAFISSENKVFGSILFCLGLFGICAFGFNLFTGKIGYVIPTKNNPNCLMIWLGNLVGCLITTVPLRFAILNIMRQLLFLLKINFRRIFCRHLFSVFFAV